MHHFAVQIYLQSEEIIRDPEMNKSAVWAGSGCMAVFPISGSRLISTPGTIISEKYVNGFCLSRGGGALQESCEVWVA